MISSKVYTFLLAIWSVIVLFSVFGFLQKYSEPSIRIFEQSPLPDIVTTGIISHGIFDVHDNPVYITLKDQGRLGNQMLQYAALFCAASSDRTRQPFLHPYIHRILRGTFPHLSIPFKKITVAQLAHAKKVQFDHFDFDKKVEGKGAHGWFKNIPSGNVSLQGYFTSHLYFTHCQDDIRREFTFSDDVIRDVKQYFRDTVPRDWNSSSFIRVGIHVRRTDRLSKFRLKLGDIIYPLRYFQHAMAFFREHYENIQFVVASDDIAWCKSHIQGKNIVFTGKSFGTDLAIMSKCDHMIISGGTFSWWAGWLCTGTTVYYGARLPTNGTPLAKGYRNRWIPVPSSQYNNWINII